MFRYLRLRGGFSQLRNEQGIYRDHREKGRKSVPHNFAEDEESSDQQSGGKSRPYRERLQMELTPQESEQLSKYVSDDSYVKKQKEDIQELASMFKDMLGRENRRRRPAYIDKFRDTFQPQPDFHARYLFMIADKKPLFIEVNGEELTIHYGQEENIDIYAKLSPEVLENIIGGRMTFQRAFMTGEMTAKGNFKILRMLDTLFNFV